MYHTGCAGGASSVYVYVYVCVVCGLCLSGE